ncbi:MAG TPA: PaaI family thioesterase [Microvirga sp.]|jgi:uncharacterized protein (TIGR00369 family)|nr:PaaI family thioesterase [Microvirga sp.]
MSGHQPKDPNFAERAARSFGKQGLMETIGARILRVAPGEVDIELPVTAKVTQQHGFVHAGAVSAVADSACGFAALTLMPASAGVLTAEFKVNLMAPAAGERLVAEGRVVKAGRTLTVAQSEVFAEAAGARKLVALLTATLVTVEGRDGIAD